MRCGFGARWDSGRGHLCLQRHHVTKARDNSVITIAWHLRLHRHHASKVCDSFVITIVGHLCLQRHHTTKACDCFVIAIVSLLWAGVVRDTLLQAGAMAPKGGIRQRLGLASGGSDRSRSPKPRSSPSSQARPSSSHGPLPVPVPASQDEDLRQVIKELFLLNDISGPKASRLARAGAKSGADGVKDLSAAGGEGKHPKNYHRDIMRNLLRDCRLPSLYFAKVPLSMDGQVLEQDFPFLLPHEMLVVLANQCPSELATAKGDPDSTPELCAIVRRTEVELGLSVGSLIPLGLHGDGVPYSKRQSLEALSWNLPGKPLWDRILFTAVPKKFLCSCGCRGKHSWDKILEVWAWSMRLLALGTHPTNRHDGGQLDTYRIKHSGRPMHVAACLAQVRRDWPFLKALFSFPAWNSTRLCWRCRATQSTYKVCGSNAPWRQERVTGHVFLAEQREAGITPSPLLRCPGMRLELVGIDWLHTMDLGVSQDVMGNLFVEAMELQGGSRASQLSWLWEGICLFYKRHKPCSQLTNLTQDMIFKPGKAPKIRAKGGETRYLVPFAVELAQTCSEQQRTDHWLTVHGLTRLLFQMYRAVSARPFSAQEGAQLCKKFCVLYQALAEEAVAAGKTAWVQKPKLHLLQELLEFATTEMGSPENFWCYRDESWVGFLGKMAHRRGGADSPLVAATRALERYRALADLAFPAPSE